MEKTICFAYYGDGEFIGWRTDTSGGIGKIPKLYSGSFETKENIFESFLKKMKIINEISYEKALDEINKLQAIGKSNEQVIIKSLRLLAYTGHETLSKYKKVELRLIECPIYDGPNEDFDRDLYENFINAHRKIYDEFLSKKGLKDDVHSKNRFRETYGRFRPKWWIYADFNKLEKWASKAPENYLQTVKFEKNEQ